MLQVKKRNVKLPEWHFQPQLLHHTEDEHTYKQQLTSAEQASHTELCVLESWTLEGAKCEQGEQHADKLNVTALQEKLYIYLQRHGESQFSPVWGRGGWGVRMYRLFVAASIYHSLLARYGETETAQHSMKKSCPAGINRVI